MKKGGGSSQKAMGAPILAKKIEGIQNFASYVQAPWLVAKKVSTI
jgi:hypothetical protein